MAEFCLDCWNKLNGTHDSKKLSPLPLNSYFLPLT